MSPPETAALDPELRELGRLVRDARPLPREAWAQKLDARVAEGFAKRGSASGPASRLARLPSLPRPRLMLPALAAAVCLIAAVGVAASLLGGKEASRPTADMAASPLQAQSRAAKGAAGAEAAPDAAAPPAPAPAPPPGDEAPTSPRRKVQRSATLALATGADDLDDVADGVVHATDDAGGFVASSQVDSGASGGTAHFDLRVPVAHLDATLAALSRLAHVRSSSEATDDVTGAVVSARERLTDAKAQRRALLRSLGHARTDTQAEAIRARLRLVRQEIAAARSDVRSLAQRTDFSSIAVTVNTDGDSGSGAFGPGDAIDDAVRILGAIAGGLLVGLAILLPAALAGAGLWLGIRASRRRGRERTLDAV
jgi:Domain of unknown function (DUF4349)